MAGGAAKRFRHRGTRGGGSLSEWRWNFRGCRNAAPRCRRKRAAQGVRADPCKGTVTAALLGGRKAGAARVRQRDAVKQRGLLGPTVEYYAAVKRSEARSVAMTLGGTRRIQKATCRRTIYRRCSAQAGPRGQEAEQHFPRTEGGFGGVCFVGTESAFMGVNGLEPETGDDYATCECAEASGSCPLQRELGGT